MNVTITLGPGYKRAKAMFDRAPKVLEDGLHNGLANALGIIADESSASVMHGRDGIQTRSGMLARSIHSYMDETNKLMGYVGPGGTNNVSRYSWLLGNQTKTIKPVKGKFLAIPIADNLTRAGVARYKSPLQIPDGFFFRSKTGGLFFGQENNKGKMKVFFVLKRSVKIEGKDVMMKAYKSHKKRIIDAVKNAVMAAIRGSNG
jgi:hypothetical protein